MKIRCCLRSDPTGRPSTTPLPTPVPVSSQPQTGHCFSRPSLCSFPCCHAFPTLVIKWFICLFSLKNKKCIHLFWLHRVQPQHTDIHRGARASLQLWLSGSDAPCHVGSQFPIWGSNLCPLHCKEDSQLLDPQGSP